MEGRNTSDTDEAMHVACAVAFAAISCGLPRRRVLRLTSSLLRSEATAVGQRNFVVERKKRSLSASGFSSHTVFATVVERYEDIAY